MTAVAWMLRLALALSVSMVVSVAAADERCFPDGFLFGTATAAFQVEGGWNASGREPSIWDAYCHAQPDVACADVADDFFHRYEDDIATMAAMGLSSFRFSVSWSRVMRWDGDAGCMRPNRAGLDFYHAVLDDLNRHGIAPLVTLYHFDLPAALHTQLTPEGWLNRDIVGHFVDFAELAFREFGAKTRFWTTFNEPLTFISGGYGSCDAAPGDMTPSTTNTYTVAHHVLLAHGFAVRRFRELQRDQIVRSDARIGIVLNGEFGYPKDPTNSKDVEAAERKMQFELGWFVSPIVTGEYPLVMRERVGKRLPQFSSEEAAVVKGSYDLFMLNHYYSRLVTDCDSPASTVACSDLSLGYQLDKGLDDVHPPLDARLPPADNPICSWLTGYPRGYLDTIKWLHAQDPTAEILLTENGWCGNDVVDNPDQLWYLQSYLEQVYKAIVDEKIPVIGYTVWSFLDNNEWGSYLPRFGLFYVNFSSHTGTKADFEPSGSDLARIPRPAAKWFARVASTGCLDGAEQVGVEAAVLALDASEVGILDEELNSDGPPWSLTFVACLFAVGILLVALIGRQTIVQLEGFHVDAARTPLLNSK